MTKKRWKRQGSCRDFNHPEDLVGADHFKWWHSHKSVAVQHLDNALSECKTIERSVIPTDLDALEQESFLADYKGWCKTFKYSEAKQVEKLKQILQTLTNTTHDDQIALMARLDCELARIAKRLTVYDKEVVVNESDEESVISALKVWGLKDEKLLMAARALHRVDSRTRQQKDEVWPRECEFKNTLSTTLADLTVPK